MKSQLFKIQWKLKKREKKRNTLTQHLKFFKVDLDEAKEKDEKK